MTHTEIVQKLIGPVRPIGDSAIDAERRQNLESLCIVVRNLLTEIISVRDDHKDSHESSRSRAGHFAAGFIQGVKDDLTSD